MITLTIEIEQESDKRWLADVTNVPGALAYGRTELEALRNALTIAYRVLAEKEPGSWT